MGMDKRFDLDTFLLRHVSKMHPIKREAFPLVSGCSSRDGLPLCQVYVAQDPFMPQQEKLIKSIY